MSVPRCTIQIDNRGGYILAGGTLEGKVVLHLDKPKKVNGILLQLEGKGKSWWDEKNGKHTTKYRARETYLDFNIQLLHRQEGQDHVVIPAGVTSYPFQIRLSSELPSSFEGRRGYVRYNCTAQIERHWMFNENTKKMFSVIRQYDLNVVPSAIHPINLEQKKEIEGCCTSSGQLDISLNVNKTGFVPGEPLLFEINIVNNTDTTVKEFILNLNQDVVYTGYSDSLFSSGRPHFHPKKDHFSLCRQYISCLQGTTFNLRRGVYVPSLPPSFLEGCNIIEINYSVELTVPCNMSSCKVKRPVLIGTVPVSVPVLPSPEVNSSDPATPTAPPSYEAPPPSYSECVFGRQSMRDEDDDEHTVREETWAPSYPFYDWRQHSNQMPVPIDTAELAPPDYNQI